MSRTKLDAEIDEKKIDVIFADLDQCRLPGAAVGVALGGRPGYRKSFGLASMDLPVVLSPTTRMRIGSTSKQFTCFAYLLLCEEGKAAIDDPLGKYFPELHPVTHQVTMRQLMGNTSGLRDAWHLKWQFSGLCGRPVESADLLTFYRDIDDVHFAPGTGWHYNNAGYELVALAIERITGRSLADVLRERVFDPLGMYDTMLRRWDNDCVPNSAIPHVKNSEGRFERAYWPVNPLGAGAVVSTVNDMLRWLAHMDAPSLGSAATWTAMKSQQQLADGTCVRFGLSWFVGQYRGIDVICAPGGWLGANAQMLKVPAAGLDVVVMVNRHDVSGALLADRVLDACLPGLGPLREPFRGPFASGTFRSPTTGRVVHLYAKEGQQIASIDGRDLPVTPGDDGVLRPDSWWSSVQFALTLVGDAFEKPGSIRFNACGTVDELVALEPAEKTDLSAIVGRYRSDTTGTELTIRESDGDLQLVAIGRFGSVIYDNLNCLADNVWLVRSTNELERWLGGSGILSFDAQGVTFSSYATLGPRGVRFQRVLPGTSNV